MREQSHKDEMSRALRGDFERLRERGVSTTLARAPNVGPREPELIAVPEPAPGVEITSQHDGIAGDRPLRGQPPAGDESPENDGLAGDESLRGQSPPEDATTSHPGRFARLFGR